MVWTGVKGQKFLWGPAAQAAFIGSLLFIYLCKVHLLVPCLPHIRMEMEIRTRVGFKHS